MPLGIQTQTMYYFTSNWNTLASGISSLNPSLIYHQLGFHFAHCSVEVVFDDPPNIGRNLRLELFHKLDTIVVHIPGNGVNVVKQKRRGKWYQEQMIVLVDQVSQGKKRTWAKSLPGLGCMSWGTSQSNRNHPFKVISCAGSLKNFEKLFWHLFRKETQ